MPSFPFKTLAISFNVKEIIVLEERVRVDITEVPETIIDF